MSASGSESYPRLAASEYDESVDARPMGHSIEPLSLPGGALPLPRPESASGARRLAARSNTELTSMRRDLDAAWIARDAAELARSRAEVARNAAEGRAEGSRHAIVLLEERIAFLDEQLRGARAYGAELVEHRLAESQLERLALLQEMSLLNEELQRRHSAEA